MRDARIAEVAGTQFNRISRRQLFALGISKEAIAHRVSEGRLVIMREGVFAVAPALDDDWGHWMELTLTTPHSFLSRVTAACAWGMLSRPPRIDTITRPGSGGPRVLDGIVVCRSSTVAEESTALRGIPITTAERTALDLARIVSGRALARAVRESVRMGLVSLEQFGDALGRFRARPGSLPLAEAVSRYSGLPLTRARSGAEVRALEILRDGGYSLPELNVRIAGEEADLVWRTARTIVEVDGGPFHLDVGEDQRKQAIWEAAGWRVRRISSDAVYETPSALLRLTPQGERP